MRQGAIGQRFIQQPVMSVIGVLIAAGAAKGGYGEWAVAGTLIYVSASLAVITIRSGADRARRMPRYQPVPYSVPTHGEKR